jgi:hypothetical protein
LNRRKAKYSAVQLDDKISDQGTANIGHDDNKMGRDDKIVKGGTADYMQGYIIILNSQAGKY